MIMGFAPLPSQDNTVASGKFCATYSRRKWEKRGKLGGKQHKIWQTEKNEDGQKNGKCQLAAAASRGKRKFLENYSTKNCETEKNEDGQKT